MGQSVNQQLGAGALGYGVDPAYVQQQILQQREKQFAAIQNPQQQLAARLGAMLGGGISNLAQDRGFFDVNDPLLNKVTQIQGIYNQVAQQIDPAANPEQFFTQLQKAYADAGLGQQALMAAQEAQKAKTSGIDVQLKETQLYEKNPELLAGRIEDALRKGNEPEANRLANLNARLTQDRELAIEAKQTAIAKDKAYIAYQNKLASDEKFEYKAVDPTNPLSGHWKFDKTGKTEPQYIPVPESVTRQLTTSPTPKGDKKDRAPLTQGYKDNTQPASAPSSGTSPVLSREDAQRLMRNQPQTQPVNWAARLQEMNNVMPPVPTPVSRDIALQRAYPTLVISTMDEATKAQLAQQLGL
jgi:hypothetical protein